MAQLEQDATVESQTQASLHPAPCAAPSPAPSAAPSASVKDLACPLTLQRKNRYPPHLSPADLMRRKTAHLFPESLESDMKAASAPVYESVPLSVALQREARMRSQSNGKFE